MRMYSTPHTSAPPPITASLLEEVRRMHACIPARFANHLAGSVTDMVYEYQHSWLGTRVNSGGWGKGTLPTSKVLNSTGKRKNLQGLSIPERDHQFFL